MLAAICHLTYQNCLLGFDIQVV